MKNYPDFTKIDFEAKPKHTSFEDWRNHFESDARESLDEAIHKTLEGVDIRPLYVADDLADCEHLQTMPGIAPYLRGPYATMYVPAPWTVRGNMPDSPLRRKAMPFIGGTSPPASGDYPSPSI